MRTPQITCTPTTDTIASCTSCRARNYGDERQPADVDTLFELTVGGERHGWTTIFCRSCLGALHQTIQPHRASVA